MTPYKIIILSAISISDIAQSSQLIITNGLKEPGPFTLIIVFFSGLLTSLGPCSLSLLPITIAYITGFKNNQSPFQRSLIFCGGIVLSLVILGTLSGLFGKIYGQLPSGFSVFVSIIAILMGLNLVGILKIQLPQGPNPDFLANNIPTPLAPLGAGLAFGLASTPCTTPVLAVLLSWIAQNGNPITGISLLACFGIGQVMPLLLVGTAAGTLPKFLAIRSATQWIPLVSGVIFITTGSLSLLSRWL